MSRRRPIRGGVLAVLGAVLACASPGPPGPARPRAGGESELPERPPRGAPVALCLGELPAKTGGGVRAVRPTSRAGRVELEVRLEGGAQDGAANRTGQALFDVREVPRLDRPFRNGARLRAEVRAGPGLLEGVRRPPRARLVLEDAKGRHMFLPNAPLGDWAEGSGGWVRIEGRPTTRIPIPLGHVDEGFDGAQVVSVGVAFDAQRPEGDVAAGVVEVRDLEVRFGPDEDIEVLPPDSGILAAELERAERMKARLAERLGRGGEELAVGVNLPYPGVKSPKGSVMQLYARYLDAPSAWFGEHHDLTNEKVRDALRRDLARIREVFGGRAIVRVMLFGDLRTGFELDADGTPLRVSDRARASIEALLRIAAEERVVLLPVLTDFLMADGRDRQGPGGKWPVGEHPALVTDPAKRRAFFEQVEDLVRAHAGHPAVLAWEVMNEPENAVAVVTPEHFGDLVRFLREGAEAIHRAGELATVGHRNPLDVVRFMRGRIPSDLGQAHFYPRLETHPAPFDLSHPPDDPFGPLPAGWGEAPVRPGRVARDLREAREAGHRYLLYWAWRGDDPTGDGFRVRAHAEEIEKALAARDEAVNPE